MIISRRFNCRKFSLSTTLLWICKETPFIRIWLLFPVLSLYRSIFTETLTWSKNVTKKMLLQTGKIRNIFVFQGANSWLKLGSLQKFLMLNFFFISLSCESNEILFLWGCYISIVSISLTKTDTILVSKANNWETGQLLNPSAMTNSSTWRGNELTLQFDFCKNKKHVNHSAVSPLILKQVLINFLLYILEKQSNPHYHWTQHNDSVL